MAIENTDAKLRFLRGLEANLPETKTDGYVYVTTDTRAMYVDYSDGATTNRIRIGDVLTVASVAALPAIATAKDGVLYYCTAENVLCTPYGSGETRKWQQINKQSTLTGIISALTVTAATETNNTGGTDAAGKALTGTATGGQVDIVGTGAVISVADNKISINAKPSSVANVFAEDGKFTTTVGDATGVAIVSTAVTPTITYGSGTTQSATFKSGTATLDVYTKDQTDTLINGKLKTANAMTFKGTLGDTTDNGTVATLPTSAALGDTYIVVTKKSYTYMKQGATAATSQSCMIGDMFVAGPGEEDANGSLKVLCWTYVPAGNDDLPVVIAKTTATDITFTSTLGGQATTIGKVAVGTGLTGINSGTTLTVKHADVSTAKPVADTAVSQNQGSPATYTAISEITTSNGHVTGIKTKQLTVVDTTLKSVGYTAAEDTNGAKLTVAVGDTAGTSKSGAVTIKASGDSAAQVSVVGGAVVIDTIWGSF